MNDMNMFYAEPIRMRECVSNIGSTNHVYPSRTQLACYDTIVGNDCEIRYKDLVLINRRANSRARSRIQSAGLFL